MSSAMHTYYYRILMPNGGVKSGVVRLMVEREFSVRLWLEREYNAVVLALYRLPEWLAATQDILFRPFRQTVRREDLAGFLRDLALMSGAGVPMLDALRTIQEEGTVGDQPRISRIAGLLLEELNAGGSVTDAFDRYPDVFPETVRNLVSIGDRSGNLDNMLLEAARHIERIIAIGRDIRTSLIYPAFVFATIFGVAIFWLYYVVPNMAQLFRQLHAKLPPITVGLVNVSDWLGSHVMLGMGMLFGTFAVAWLTIRNVPGAKPALYELGHKLPIVRVLLNSSGLAHVTEHLALLISAGLDVVTSMDVLARATRDIYYKKRLIAMRDRVARGERIASAMRQVGGFPSMVTRMVAVGEESGTLSTQLEHLATEYRQRLNRLVASLGEIIKPAVILIAGALFLFLIVALLLPVYDLVRQTISMSMSGS